MCCPCLPAALVYASVLANGLAMFKSYAVAPRASRSVSCSCQNIEGEGKVFCMAGSNCKASNKQCVCTHVRLRMCVVTAISYDLPPLYWTSLRLNTSRGPLGFHRGLLPATGFHKVLVMSPRQRRVERLELRGTVPGPITTPRLSPMRL